MKSKSLCIISFILLCCFARGETPVKNINPALFAGRWPAQWIKVDGAAINDYGIYHFRKTISLDEKPSGFVVHVSADNRYKLYVNGNMVSLGPARSDVYNWAYETVDIAPYLQKGENTLAAVVWNFGEHNPVAQMSFNKTGFLLQGNGEKEQIVNTNNSWKGIENKSYSPVTVDLRTYFVVGPGENIDANAYPWGWEKPAYNDASWKAAVPIIQAGGKGSRDYPGWQLIPRAIPQMELTDERIKTLRKAEGITVPEGFPSSEQDVKIPANSQVKLLLDQTYLTTAYLHLLFSKGKGAEVTIRYAESLYNNIPVDKGNRDEIDGKIFFGYYDRIKPDGGENRQYTTLWWRTYRYLELEIITSAEPLTLHDIYGTFTAYPFEQAATFSAPEMPEADKILSVGWRTARLCAHETYMDCPYYEQLQYFGDTRIQAMITLYNTTDDRLVRNAIDNGRQSMVADGITMSRYPTNLHQYITSFSIWWIGTVHDYWMYRGDDNYIREQLPYIRTIIDYYERRLQPDGSLSKLPFWFFTDWSDGFNYGEPPRLENGQSAIQDLHFLSGLQFAADMEDKLGDKSLAAHYRSLAGKIMSGFRGKYWDTDRGLFADTPQKDRFSQHANILSILCGIVEGEEARAVMQQLLKDKSLVQASIYFRYYLNMALVKSGMGNDYLNMLDIWHTQLSLGLTTWAEQPEPSRSDCHAWGASPNIEFFRTVLGIRSNSPGFEQVVIAPNPGKLTDLKGTMPHPKGVIDVKYKLDKKGNIRADITLPPDTEGTFIWKGKSYKLTTGKQVVKNGGQSDPAWDDTVNRLWSRDFENVEIPSTADGKIQKAVLHRSKSKAAKPLIVSLHTWSGNYEQHDPVAGEIALRDWNYIHPDFRGPNNTPEAMGSPLVVSDIEDAIRYALETTNSDPDDVHIVGVSGGGYAALVAYMNVAYPVKSFSAWVPVSDVEAWYWESIGRNQKYAGDILAAVSTDGTFNSDEARRRSPLWQDFPKDKRKDAELYIYTGVHDGYTGSVPITHSIHIYNRIAGEIKYNTPDYQKILLEAATDPVLVSEKQMLDLIVKRINPEHNNEKKLFEHTTHLNRKYENIHLTIFEGGHGQIFQALALLPVNNKTNMKYNILTIGDSNAANKDGWVEQLKKMMPESHIVNISQSGRTIGFDNNGREELNALKNIDRYLDSAQEQIKGEKYDYIIVCLGTNDTKAEFAGKQDEVINNYSNLLDRIKAHPLSKKSKPVCIYVTPPPVGTKNIEDKYIEGNERLTKLIPQFTGIATKKGFKVIDIYHPLQGIFEHYAPDGVHMVGEGQEFIAAKIIEMIR